MLFSDFFYVFMFFIFLILVIFLLSAKAGGTGLNLMVANRIILFEPDWNPSTDQQTMGRVHRVGQKKEVHVYRLLCTGTIEEKIFQRQIAKLLLSDNVIGQSRNALNDDPMNNRDDGSYNNEGMDDFDPRHFSKEDLKRLFQIRTNTRADTMDIFVCF